MRNIFCLIFESSWFRLARSDGLGSQCLSSTFVLPCSKCWCTACLQCIKTHAPHAHAPHARALACGCAHLPPCRKVSHGFQGTRTNKNDTSRNVMNEGDGSRLHSHVAVPLQLIMTSVNISDTRSKHMHFPGTVLAVRSAALATRRYQMAKISHVSARSPLERKPLQRRQAVPRILKLYTAHPTIPCTAHVWK